MALKPTDTMIELLESVSSLFTSAPLLVNCGRCCPVAGTVDAGFADLKEAADWLGCDEHIDEQVLQYNMTVKFVNQSGPAVWGPFINKHMMPCFLKISRAAVKRLMATNRQRDKLSKDNMDFLLGTLCNSMCDFALLRVWADVPPGFDGRIAGEVLLAGHLPCGRTSRGFLTY